MRLSIIVPCYNEESVVAETHRRLVETLGALGETDHEILFVDDGSTDGTAEKLREILKVDENVRVIRLSRNFGHQIAVTAGIEGASGSAVVIIDADLQDPPEVIGEMIKEWENGAQVVYGVRKNRAGETRFKLATAKAFYRIINSLSDTPIPHDTGDFRLMDRRAVNALLAMPEGDRFVRGMVSWVGFRQTPVYYDRVPRAAGRSKYPFVKMARFAVDGIISFSTVPLRLAIWIGFFSIGLAFAGIVLALVERYLGLYDLNLGRGWASLFVAVLFIGGVQLLTLGIIGEYIGRIYTEVKRRPLYIVMERLGFDE